MWINIRMQLLATCLDNIRYFRYNTGMQKIIKIVVVIIFTVLIALALRYIGDPENSMNASKDWGIAKDHPLKMSR